MGRRAKLSMWQPCAPGRQKECFGKVVIRELQGR
jgi:hypothetical protein